MRFTPRQKDIQLRLHGLLAEAVDTIGPNAEGAADYEPGEGPVGEVTLREVAVVCCWVDENGDAFPIALPGDGMLPHHVAGLLRDGARTYD